MEKYDVAVIGTGPAGISAAITLKIRNKSVILIGPAKGSEKISRAAEILNYPGLPAVSGRALADALTGHLAAMDIPVTQKRVSAVYAMGDYFGIQADTDMIEARAVILATGVAGGNALPGEAELLGRGVSYCATCDASLYRGQSVAVIGYNEEAAGEAEFLSEVVSDVTYYPMSKYAPDERENLRVLREVPTAVSRGDDGAVKVVTAGGEREYRCVFILRNAVAADRLVPGLKTDGAHVAVDLNMKTNLAGLFACGDIAGRPYQYIKAAGQGNVAALSAVEYLDSKNKDKR